MTVINRVVLILGILGGNFIFPLLCSKLYSPLYYKGGSGELRASTGSLAWADDPEIAETKPVYAHIILGGVVKSVSWADPNKDTKSEIAVKDTTGKIINILVMPTTTLWDKDAVAIMPDKIVPKAKVNVIYFTTPEGLNIGKSIKILK